MDVLPFKKPEKKARLETPGPGSRKEMLNELIGCVAAIEAAPDFVGYAVIGLMSDGRRISSWDCVLPAAAQLERQVRREAAQIAARFRKES